MDDLLSEFITETNESLEELDLDLVNLEKNPNDKDLLGKIFRLMHTIKGTCGFLSLPRLEKVAHHAENVLGRFRDGVLDVTPEYVTLIFESIDVIKFIVGAIAETGQEPDGDDSEIIVKLDAVFEGKASEDAPEEKVEESTDSEAAEYDIDQYTGEPIEFTPVPAGTSFSSPEEEKATEPEKEVPKPVAEKPAEKPVEKAKTEGPVTPTQTLRVNVDVLEDLMTMVSELVLTRNQLLQILRAEAETEFTTPLQRLDHVVSELQEGVMKTRMQPIGNAWSKLPRIIRDLSLELNKKIELEMRGQETELDRQVLELIKDPLTHMVRNSGDHGIEDPATRVANGKPEMGKILLNAYHEGGHIIIQISDDGKGLPLDRIKEKIIANGLATADELEKMPDQQIQQFIFKAGFSTAEKVTSVSGRGVGMDVVRTNIEKIGGFIELNSVEGKGSTFTIKIPLTLAIVSALIVEAAEERFAIPQLAVRELVLASETGNNRIEMIKGTPVFRLRDRLLPLVSLSELLQIEKLITKDTVENIVVEQAAEQPPSAAEVSPDEEATANDETPDEEATDNIAHTDGHNRYIIVTHVGTYDFGIIVDRVFDTEEIVVKPVSKILRDIELFSGNTILGDGTVIMILDPNGIAKATGEIETNNDADSANAADDEHDYSNQKTSLLLFNAGDGAPKTVPLSLVSRLEQINTKDIERSGGQMMIQYREKLMPMVTFDSSVQLNEAEDKPVLVFADKDQSLGIIVDEIIDITEEHIDVQLGGDQEGLMGSAIINGKATDVVDVGYFLRSVNKKWFMDHDDKPFEHGGTNDATEKRRVLLVDDSPFFRNMLTPLLSVAGYEVTTLESPLQALKMCEDGAHFDVIVSDIEMPEMNGFEFAEKVKADSNWQYTPMVALSSHATPQDIDRGIEVGFNKYVAKFDRDTLLDTLSQTLSEANEKMGEAS